MLTGGLPVLSAVAPFSIQRRSVWYPLAVGSRMAPPTCLMSVVTVIWVPSQSCTSTAYGGTFFTSIEGWRYGP